MSAIIILLLVLAAQAVTSHCMRAQFTWYADESEAKAHKPMTNARWISKIGEFLRIFECGVPDHANSVLHMQALAKAEADFERFNTLRINTSRAVESAFEDEGVKAEEMRISSRQRGEGCGR